MLSTIHGFKMTDNEVMEAISGIDGEIVFNCSFIHQKVLIIRNGKFIVANIVGDEWSFNKFEQACFFAVASDGCPYLEEDGANKRALKVFPD